MLEELFNQDLRNYLVQMSSPASALLDQLEQETLQKTQAAHLLCGPVQGKLLQFLVKLSHAKSCLEIGTFTGYSALNIAQALPADGELMTCEIRPAHAEIAKKYFALSPHGHKITLCLAPALTTIAALDKQFDFIFIDADKANYPVYFKKLLPKLRPGGLMVVDNALWRGQVINADDREAAPIHNVNLLARQDPSLETVLLTVRDGLLLIFKKCPAE